MKNLAFKFTLLVFFSALLSGFYLHLPLVDNLIRSFVIYLLFSVIFLVVSIVINQASLESLKSKQDNPEKSGQDKIKQATPTIAK